MSSLPNVSSQHHSNPEGGAFSIQQRMHGSSNDELLNTIEELKREMNAMKDKSERKVEESERRNEFLQVRF